MRYVCSLILLAMAFASWPAEGLSQAPLAPPEAKVFVEAVDSIDFPTVTVYFRYLDLNPDTPFRSVDENMVSLGEDGQAVAIVPDSFERLTRPISVLLMADGSTSMSKIYPTLKQALITFADKMASYDDPDEIALALFSERANACNIKVVQDFTNEPDGVKQAAAYIGQMVFDIYNPTFCSSVYKAFHQGVELCNKRSKDGGLDENVRNLPRMIVSLTDGKEHIIAEEQQNFMPWEDMLNTVSTGHIPCYVIGCGEVVDFDPDKRVVAVDALSQIAEASEGALCLTTGPGSVQTSTSMNDKIENYFDKVIASYKYIYRIRFNANDETIDTGELRPVEVKIENIEGKGSYLPPVVVNEDEEIEINYPLDETMENIPPVEELKWHLSFHRDFDYPRNPLSPLPYDQEYETREDGTSDGENLTLTASFKTPTQASYIPKDNAEYKHLCEPYFRYGVTISPFDVSTDEKLKGKIVAAFPIYVRDTTPPNVSFGLRTRDIPADNEIRVTEVSSSDSYDESPTSLPRNQTLYLSGKNFKANNENYQYGPRQITAEVPSGMKQPVISLERLAKTAYDFADAIYTKANVRMTVTQCGARDNISFASISGYEDPRNKRYEEILEWTDYLNTSGQEPRSVKFPPAAELRDTPEIPRPCLQRLSYEMLQKPIKDGGKAGICWYIERAGEYVPRSDCFNRWVLRASNVDERGDFPFLPGKDTHIRIVARDHAGNETNILVPLKAFGVDIDVRSLDLKHKKSW